MRRGRLITCAIVTLTLAPLACGSSETAIEIDVQLGTVPPASVLMFLARPGPLAPVPLDTGSGQALPTQIYGELEAGADLVQVADVQTPGEAVFVYKPGADGLGDTIPIAIAVGMSGGAVTQVGTVTGLAVFPGKVARYSITLGESGPPDPNDPNGPRGVQLWGATDPTQACVLVAGSGNTDAFTAIVHSTDDPDCDGFPKASECPGDDYTFDGSTSGSDRACAGTLDFTTPGPPGFSACALGAPRCTDGSTTTTCGPDSADHPPLCAFPSLCTACADPTVPVAQCVSSLATLVNVTRIACDFEFTIDLPDDVAVPCEQFLVLPGSNNPGLVQPELEVADGTFTTSQDLGNGQTTNLAGNTVAIGGTPVGFGSAQALLVSSPGSLPDGQTVLRGGAIPIRITSHQAMSCDASDGTCSLLVAVGSTGSADLGDAGERQCLDISGEGSSSGSGSGSN